MSETALINLTPHPVDIVREHDVITIGPSSPTPRVEITRSTATSINIAGSSVPLYEVSRGSTIDLPPQRDGITLIVSRMVAEENPERADLVFPLDLVRDDHGGVRGCTALGRLAR